MPPIAPPPNLPPGLETPSPEEVIEMLLAQCAEHCERIEVLVLAVQDLGDEVNRLLAARKRTLRRAATYRQQIAVMEQDHA